TGAGKGIGRSIALKLAKQGANVVINYHTSKTKAIELENEIKKAFNVQAKAVKADVSNKLEVKEMMSLVEEDFGRLDVLVNNAGVLPIPQYWKSISQSAWEETISTNLFGSLNCIQAAGPLLTRNGGGTIINISSVFSLIGSPYVPAYAISKAGLNTLTISLAKDLAPDVTVNTIAPGNIDTEMTRRAGEEFVSKIIESTPLQRLGEPEDIANAVYFLSSEMGRFITGQVIVVDGGFMLK
ncbi:MAG: SDR family oxidoreductase, partial [Cyanobacteria bacterium J06649_11]